MLKCNAAVLTALLRTVVDVNRNHDSNKNGHENYDDALIEVDSMLFVYEILRILNIRRIFTLSSQIFTWHDNETAFSYSASQGSWDFLRRITWIANVTTRVFIVSRVTVFPSGRGSKKQGKRKKKSFKLGGETKFSSSRARSQAWFEVQRNWGKIGGTRKAWNVEHSCISCARKKEHSDLIR